MQIRNSHKSKMTIQWTRPYSTVSIQGVLQDMPMVMTTAILPPLGMESCKLETRFH